ncbi:MAG: hypothetical protein KKB31_07775 [Nanoarchaeota archaeon]|nr:hypothetical protein [Nanoarchaeota archaeon]
MSIDSSKPLDNPAHVAGCDAAGVAPEPDPLEFDSVELTMTLSVDRAFLRSVEEDDKPICTEEEALECAKDLVQMAVNKIHIAIIPYSKRKHSMMQLSRAMTILSEIDNITSIDVI